MISAEAEANLIDFVLGLGLGHAHVVVVFLLNIIEIRLDSGQKQDT